MKKRKSNPKESSRRALSGLQVVFIGAGNVGTHLAQEFLDAGASIVQTFRKSKKAAGKKFTRTTSVDLKKINPDADIYIIAVPDDSIAAVAKAMPLVKGIVVHTSGSVPITALKRHKKHGVFYPLQSFTKGKPVTVNAYAVCIEGSSPQVVEDLMECAGGISKNAYVLNSAQREHVHLAAVFANNFSNHLFAVAEKILAGNKLPFELIKPLILETAFKVMDTDPKTAQTGPAKRNDKKTMARHLAMLKDDASLTKLYRKLSKHIRS